MPKGKDILTALVRERLAALRDAYGLTDAGMARAARQRQQDVSRFFNGDTKYPPLDFLDSLARVVNLTLADVLAADVAKIEMPDWQLRVIASLKAMEPHERIAYETLITRGEGGASRPRARRANR